MARHRNVRKLNYDEECDFDDVYGRSVEDAEYCISPGTAAEFMYDRTSNTHSMSAFIQGDHDHIPEENLESEEEAAHHEQKVPLLSDLDEGRLRSCLDELHNIVGDSIPEGTLISAVVTNDFNVERALNAVLNSQAPPEAPKPQRERRERRPREDDDYSTSDSQSSLSDDSFSPPVADIPLLSSENSDSGFSLGGSNHSTDEEAAPSNNFQGDDLRAEGASEFQEELEVASEKNSDPPSFATLNLSSFLPRSKLTKNLSSRNGTRPQVTIPFHSAVRNNTRSWLMPSGVSIVSDIDSDYSSCSSGCSSSPVGGPGETTGIGSLLPLVQPIDTKGAARSSKSTFCIPEQKRNSEQQLENLPSHQLPTSSAPMFGVTKSLTNCSDLFLHNQFKTENKESFAEMPSSCSLRHPTKCGNMFDIGLLSLVRDANAKPEVNLSQNLLISSSDTQNKQMKMTFVSPPPVSSSTATSLPETLTDGTAAMSLADLANNHLKTAPRVSSLKGVTSFGHASSGGVLRPVSQLKGLPPSGNAELHYSAKDDVKKSNLMPVVPIPHTSPAFNKKGVRDLHLINLCTDHFLKTKCNESDDDNKEVEEEDKDGSYELDLLLALKSGIDDVDKNVVSSGYSPVPSPCMSEENIELWDSIWVEMGKDLISIPTAKPSSFAKVVCLRLRMPHVATPNVSRSLTPTFGLHPRAVIDPFDFSIPSPDDIVFAARNNP